MTKSSDPLRDHPSPTELPSQEIGHKASRLSPAASRGTLRGTSRGFPEISSLVMASGHRIVLTVGLSLALAAIFSLIAATVVPAQYMATGMVRVNQREGYLLTLHQSRADDAAFVRAQESAVLQPTTLERALENATLKSQMRGMDLDDEVEWLQAQLKADIPPGSELMTITSSNPNSKMALSIARAVTQAYVDTTLEQIQSGRQKRIEELEVATREADQKLRERWKTLQDKAEKIGAGNPQALSFAEQMKMQSFREASQRLRALHLQRGQLEIQIAEQKKRVVKPETATESQVQESVSQNLEVIARSEHLRILDGKIRELQELVLDSQSPKLVRLRTERELQAKELEEFITNLSERTRAKLQPTEAPASVHTQSLEQQLALVNEEETFLRGTVLDLEKSIERTVGPSGVELEIVRNEIDREKVLADNLWKTLQELRIEEQAEPRIALLELPVAADKLSRSKQLKAVLVGMISGMMVALLSVGYTEWSSCRIRSAEDIRNFTGLEVFGFVGPSAWSRWWRNLLHRDLPAATGGISEVAASLLRNSSSFAVPSVLVTSAVESEPRSRIAHELAQTLAGHGRKVLLINCDVTDQRFHEIWSSTGTASGRDDSWKSNRLTSTHCGYTYYSMTQSDQPLSWILGRGLEAIVQEANSLYDSIVLLGPSLLSTSEAVFAAFHVEKSILAIEVGTSRWNLQNAARNRLELSQTEILGAVLCQGPSTEVVAASSPNTPLDESPSTLSSDEESLHEQVQLLRDQLVAHQNHVSVRAPSAPAFRQDKSAIAPNRMNE